MLNDLPINCLTLIHKYQVYHQVLLKISTIFEIQISQKVTISIHMVKDNSNRKKENISLYYQKLTILTWTNVL